MRKEIYFIIIMLIFIGCNKYNKQNHNNVMSEKEMVDYLIQLHISEAKIKNLRLKKDSAEEVFNIYEKYILSKNNLSDSLFINSYNYYLQFPKKLELIYESVVDSISVRKSKDNVIE